jgi:hypothetical protein
MASTSGRANPRLRDDERRHPPDDGGRPDLRAVGHGSFQLLLRLRRLFASERSELSAARKRKKLRFGVPSQVAEWQGARNEVRRCPSAGPSQLYFDRHRALLALSAYADGSDSEVVSWAAISAIGHSRPGAATRATGGTSGGIWTMGGSASRVKSTPYVTSSIPAASTPDSSAISDIYDVRCRSRLDTAPA